MRFRQFFGLKSPVSRKQSFASSHLSHVAHPAVPGNAVLVAGVNTTVVGLRAAVPHLPGGLTRQQCASLAECVIGIGRQFVARLRATARSALRLDKNGRWRADLSERMFSVLSPLPDHVAEPSRKRLRDVSAPRDPSNK